MSDLQAVLDRVEIEALCGAFTDAAMMRDHDRVWGLRTVRGSFGAYDGNLTVRSGESPANC